MTGLYREGIVKDDAWWSIILSTTDVEGWRPAGQHLRHRSPGNGKGSSLGSDAGSRREGKHTRGETRLRAVSSTQLSIQ